MKNFKMIITNNSLKDIGDSKRINSTFKWSYTISFVIKLLIIFITTTRTTSVAAHEDKLAKYYEHDSLWKNYDKKLEFDKYLGESLVAQDLVFGLDTDIHRYDSELDLRRSFKHEQEAQFEPFIERESEKCGQQMGRMLQQAKQIYSNSSSFLESKNLALIDLLDSFGSPNSQILLGSYWWLGSYTQCKQARFEEEPARYCVSKLKSPNWTQQAQYLKLSLCLPSRCNSLTIRDHLKKLQELVRLSRLQMVPFNNYTLSDVYCLPDRESPLRQLQFSAQLFVYLALAWLLVVLVSNLRYEYLRMLIEGVDKPKTSYLVRSLSLRLNFASIFANTTPSTPTKKSKDNYEISNILKVSSDNGPICDEKAAQSCSRAPNLNYADGIKVMSMLWLIGGHWLLYMMRSIDNQRDFWSILKDPRYMSILSGIFPVDTFFVVTGFLIAYQKFHKGEHESKFSSSIYWLETVYKRYARLMPMYVLVFWFTRDVSQYLTDGPLWDYATSNSTVRGICKVEPISEALLFRANFKPMELHCVKPAWYLACDFQFLCVAPVFLYALAKSPRFAKILIYSSILLSLSNQFLTIYTRNDVDWEVLINYRPLFPVYVLKKFWQIYVLPWNRMTPFLLGLLTGHRVFVEQSQAIVDPKTHTSDETNGNKLVIGKWSMSKLLSSYLGLDLWAPIIVLISIAHFPMLSSLHTYTGIEARIGTSLVTSVMRVVWSLAAARLIYICNNYSSCESGLKSNLIFRLINCSMWTPLSRIGLSVLLIQWEVIALLAQSPDHLSNMRLSFLYSNIFIAWTATYALSLLGYLLFEAPIANLEQKYLLPLLFPRQQKSSKQKSSLINKS